MDDQTQTSRTCSVCGLKKPLMAFLELASGQGHTYGDICSTCRGTGLGQKKTREIEATEKSGGSTRFQIDNKMRIQIEQDKREEFKNQTELDQKEKSKKDTLVTDKATDSAIRKDAEKKHRDEYLATKTSTFPTTKNPDNLKTSSVTEGLRKQTQDLFSRQTQVEKTQTQQTAENQLEASQEQKNLTSTDLANTYIDDPHSVSVRRSDASIFAQFRKSIGAGAAINKSTDLYKKNVKGTAGGPGTLLSSKPQAQTETGKQDKGPDAVKKFINTLKPR